MDENEDVLQITQELDVPSTLPSAVDIVVVFGATQLHAAELAGTLALEGRARYVALTGGYNARLAATEAETHFEMLRRMGVPQSQVILENTSTNTLENVLHLLPALEQVMTAHVVTSVAVATKWYHCRRAMMTLKRHVAFPATYFSLTYEPSSARRDNWWMHEDGIRRVYKERQRIPQYLAKGDIAEIVEVEGGYA